MKLWRNILVMTAAMLSIASCSGDDDTDVYEAAELSGMWQKVYDEGIADAGIAQYTFHPQSANNGTVEIFTSDMLDICIYLPNPMTPQLPSPWIATSAASPAHR